MSSPALSTRAAKDLGRIARIDAKSARVLVRAIESMAQTPTPANLDVKALAGRSPWMRLRVGDWRVVFRPLLGRESSELSRVRAEPVEPRTLYIERIVNRRDLERIVAALP